MPGPVVITGGGTGGHVFPMQAVAEALRSRGLQANDLRFVGSRRGQESLLLGASDVALTRLPGRGLRRSWRARDTWTNLGSALGLLTAALLALGLVRKWRPSVVVSVGGYAAFAVSFAAVCWRVPLVLVEFDATPGAVHRFVGRFATKRCCAFPSTEANVVVTGAPLRASVESVDRSLRARDEAKSRLTPSIDAGRSVVVVMTGSLGSGRVNSAVYELAGLWATRRDRAIVHVTGRRDYLEYLALKPASDGLDYRVVAFADMAELWTITDTAICRAGAITVAELTALAIPSILVPLPGAPHDHQTKNALLVESAGGAVVLSDADCTGAALALALEEIMKPSKLEAMSKGAGTLARHGAADAIARVVLDVRGAS
jgi:UDP-N-acetylglucosamine--N-acetylmuramyl-(pentapeptide) pyrophosphoryl-undecaprenol N-acetylglucosamine transferase